MEGVKRMKNNLPQVNAIAVNHDTKLIEVTRECSDIESLKKEIEKVLRTKPGEVLILDSFPTIGTSADDIPSEYIEKIRDAICASYKVPYKYLFGTKASGIPISIFALGNNDNPDLK